MIHLFGPLSLWERGAASAPIPPTPAVGGAAARRRRRHYVIGDKHVIVDDRTELEAVVAALAATAAPIAPAKEVRAKEPVPAADIATPDAPQPLRIDWDALGALLRQSIRLDQPEVVLVIRAMMKRADDDEDDIEALLLS